MTFFERTLCFPPILCRLLARHKGGKPLTAAEIAERSGEMPNVCHLLCVSEVVSISRATCWKGIGVNEMFAFLRGCGLMFDDTKAMRRVDDYLSKKPTLHYLVQSAEYGWDNYYKPLLMRWRNAYPYNIGPADMPHKHLRQLLNRLTPLHESHTNITKP